MPDQPAYGIIDPDYARVYTQARVIAWQYGYACVMHGSFTRDLDLLMVPWDKNARPNREQIVKLIAESCNLRVPVDIRNQMTWTSKPHGRKALSLHFPDFADRRWVDISFMPCRPNLKYKAPT